MTTTIFRLFFFLLLCIGCSNHNQEKAISLNGKIAKVPILSARFDSLLQNIYQLPSHQRIESIIQISYRNEIADGILKQEKLLQEVLSIAPKSKQKELLLRLIAIYDKQNRSRFPVSSIKGLKCIDQLERQHSLTQDERWYLSKMKAYFFDKQGKQEEYVPIWFNLLKEHRAANRFELIIEDLNKIAGYFEMLGDKESAIALYEEAYQLSINKNIPKYRNKCLQLLTLLLYENKRYQEAINYCKNDTSYNSTLIDCYLGINKPDSARIILVKELAEKGPDKVFLNLQMAETYIKEAKEDSASIFLGIALNAFQTISLHHQNKNTKISLPSNFLYTYPMYAELLQKNGKTKQAAEAYQLIEPLMRIEVQSLKWKEIQINAITSYSVFCRNTKQYEKALELLAHRDSLQQVYRTIKEEQEKTNLIHRFEVGELTHRIDMQDIELEHSKTLNAILLGVGIVGTLLLTMIGLLYRERRRQSLKLYQQYEQLQKLDKDIDTQQETPNPSQALFIKIEKKVRAEKLFLREDLSIEILSDMLNSNRTYISASINECTSKSFSTWINDLRVNYAIKLMHKDTTLDTKRLALQCGFSTNETFYKNFKQRCGVKPSQYLVQIIIEQGSK